MILNIQNKDQTAAEYSLVVDDLKLELWLYRQGCWRPGAAGLAFLRFGGYLKLKKEDWSRR
jgi:hypothetical protein